ncbi:hypothetical protein Tsubulata_043742 [Turnera subulata]|uniref:BHLH domain-containing protein n=1 Tax=Turnera subulata TaxID=218843 RepID=A0A9Q0FG46_9ROSI|nr:hypothetical protein Tsubulata_043742 [Turnera subulata]
MFPYQQSDASSSQIFSDPHQEDAAYQEVLMFNQASLEGRPTTDLAYSIEETHQQNVLANSNTNNDDNITCYDKKSIRKESERQRRKEMSSLHSTLRSLLPVELIKGKRSISDVTDAAVNHIKYLKDHVKELSIRRDKLRMLSNSSAYEEKNQISSNSLMNYVTVSPYLGGVEINISRIPRKEVLLMSKVVAALLEEGFDVVSCVTTQRDGRSFNTIQCQVNIYNSMFYSVSGRVGSK